MAALAFSISSSCFCRLTCQGTLDAACSRDYTPHARAHIHTFCRWGCVQCTNSTRMRWGGCSHKRKRAASCITLRPSIKGTQLLCLSRFFLSPCRCSSLPHSGRARRRGDPLLSPLSIFGSLCIRSKVVHVRRAHPLPWRHGIGMPLVSSCRCSSQQQTRGVRASAVADKHWQRKRLIHTYFEHMHSCNAIYTYTYTDTLDTHSCNANTFTSTLATQTFGSQTH